MDTASNGSATGKFIMQYNETDWEFVKRLASHFNAGLVADSKSKGAKYFFGLPDGTPRGKLEEYNYRVTKKITDYLRSKENHNTSLMDLDRVFYEVSTDKFYNIGDSIKYNEKNLYINEAIYEIENSLINNVYKLTTKKGCSVDMLYNEKIIGLSLQGTVIETAKDELKLHLCIDKSQDVGKAHFFKYTTMYTANGNSGWYCMPELEDTVYAYFPDKEEWNGVTLNAIRTKDVDSDKIKDPDTKYFRTKYGKELKFDPEEILITCVDEGIFIRLNQKTGIEIMSTKPIKVHTKSDLTIDSDKKIYITAKEEINMTCKTSLMKMDGNVLIQGKEVRNN